MEHGVHRDIKGFSRFLAKHTVSAVVKAAQGVLLINANDFSHAMTAQIHDVFLLQDKRLSIVEVSGGGLFHPQKHDMQPRPRITSCWRGYFCTYAILHDRLVLESLQVNLNQEGPVINSAHPLFSASSTFDNIDHEIHLPMDFTGGILATDGFIQKLYVHMRFQPAWKFETVFELTFSTGTLLETKDVSRQMAELRERMSRQQDPYGPGIV